MELDELKNIWHSQMANEFQLNKHSPEQINLILMKNKSTIDKIRKNNKFWLIWIYIAAPIAVVGNIFSIVEQHLFPEKFPNYAVGYNFVIIIFVLLVTLLYYVQHKIFNFNVSSVDLKTALQRATSRFKDFYKVSTGIYIILFPFIFFVLIDSLTNINYTAILWLSLVTSVIALYINHLYYKRTYLKWIEHLENNLQDLEKME